MKKENLLLVISAVIITWLVTYTNCGLQVRPDNPAKQNTSSNTVNNANLSLSETFTQPSIASTKNKPEVVFVLDTSGSMAMKVAQIKAAITGWINQLSSQGIKDFCLGAMTAKSTAAQTGLLVSAAGNEKCYCTFGANAVSANVAATKFGQNMDAILSSAAGGGSEEAMIYSMHKALNDPAKLSANQAAGCFRNDTTLVTVLVSDEEDVGAAPNNSSLTFDQSKLLPAGQNFSSVRGNAYFNLDGADEAQMRRNYYCRNSSGNYVINAGKYINQIDHETIHDDIVDFNGSFPSFGTSIGFYPLNLPDPSIYSEPFWGGMQFAESFGTTMVDLKDAMDGNQAAFQNRMNDMADAMASSILYFKKFDLSKEICDSNNDGDYSDEDIRVTVNGTSVANSNYTVATSGKRITFDAGYPWTPSAKVEITYFPCKE